MNSIKNPKIYIPIAVSVAVILAGAAGWYFFIREDSPVVTQTTAETIPEEDEINITPPTDEEQQAGDKQKEELEKDDVETPVQSSGLKKVTPVVVSSGQFQGQFEVSARVPGIVEETGKCTLTLSKDGKTFSASKKASANVSETSCGFIGIDRSKLSAGTWTAVISYESPKSKGISKETPVRVD